MNRHGSPAIGRKIMRNIIFSVSSKIHVAYYKEKPVSAIIVTFDDNLAWVPWGASDPNYSSLCPNNLTYWEAIKDACRKNYPIFDFGRSPYGGNTYSFKKQWGAYPVKIEIITDKQYDIYNKYKLAAAIWQKLPLGLTNIFGPLMAKHLSDI
jgi:lipid II:glycine glycyltransferase (peptidoglycan interpeptide bridge formation enzyme)